MSFKLKVLSAGVKIFSFIKNTLEKVKKIFPKRENSFTREVAELKADLQKHKQTVAAELENLKKEIKPKVLEKVKEVTKEYYQIELYTSTANKGKKGSPEISGYILINLPKEEIERIKERVFNINVYKLKDALNIPKEMLVVGVEKGESYSNIKTGFIDIDGNMKNINTGAEALAILKI